MCAIVGALLANVTSEQGLAQVNAILSYIMEHSRERGRDGWGYTVGVDNKYSTRKSIPFKQTEIEKELLNAPPLAGFPSQFFLKTFDTANFIANLRAEPTTEYVEHKQISDQQPYNLWPYNTVHNGTIANDKIRRTYKLETRIDSAAVPEFLATCTGGSLEDLDPQGRLMILAETVHALQGSWAILATPQDTTSQILAAVNYRPLWFITTKYGFFFASSRKYFPRGYTPEMLTPYSQHIFGIDNLKPYHKKYEDFPHEHGKRAIVVCSGGLDSTVAARQLQLDGYEIELVHFTYGSRAEGPETQAVRCISDALQCPLSILPLPIYKPSDSPLLQKDSKIAGGEEGAEFAHEWVPARNLVLLSVATAYAEAKGFDTIALGNNLEEAGAYPDNEPEFIHRFNDILPFAVGVNKSIRLVMPVGNLMKHEIVALGLRNGAPLHLTWSCYRAGEKHCGKCGPCYMRRKAFEINHAEEVIQYEE